MPIKVMRTLWDVSDEVSSETHSTRSVLSDDYTSGNIKELRERIEGEIDDKEKTVEGEMDSI